MFSPRLAAFFDFQLSCLTPSTERFLLVGWAPSFHTHITNNGHGRVIILLNADIKYQYYYIQKQVAPLLNAMSIFKFFFNSSYVFCY